MNDITLYAGANTYKGFVGYYNNIKEMFNLEKFYILKGTSGSGKNTFLKKFREQFNDQPAIILYCSADPDSWDGVIIPNLNVGIIDGTAPHVVDDGGEHIILSDNITNKKIEKLQSKKQKAYNKIYNSMKKAYSFHMQLEAEYKPLIDFKSHQELLDNCVAAIRVESVPND
ncbi:MAG: hypothetical protein FWD32_02355 [Firmicutes bacterium]|nr:hypothetical protein [Bacillota bacterium]